MKIKMPILTLPSFSFFPSVTLIHVIHMDIFVKYFLATTRFRILKFGTKLDSNEMYSYCLSVLLLVHFSFSPMKISVTDFLASRAKIWYQ